MRTFLLTILLLSVVVVTGFHIVDHRTAAGLSLGVKSSAASYGSFEPPRPRPRPAPRKCRKTSFAARKKESSMTLHLVADASSETVVKAAVSFWQNTDVWVFIAGVFPFAWATVEFWRRVMFGEPFGTGSDSIIINSSTTSTSTTIGMDDAPSDSRGRRVLGRGALITAYVLFAISFATLGIVLYSVATSSPLPDVLPSSSSTSPILL